MASVSSKRAVLLGKTDSSNDFYMQTANPAPQFVWQADLFRKRHISSSCQEMTEAQARITSPRGNSGLKFEVWFLWRKK